MHLLSFYVIDQNTVFVVANLCPTFMANFANLVNQFALYNLQDVTKSITKSKSTLEQLITLVSA